MTGRALRLLGLLTFSYGYLIAAPYRYTYRPARRFQCPQWVAWAMYAEHVRDNVRGYPAALRDWKAAP